MKFIRKSPADMDNLESPQKFGAFFLDYYPRIKGFINGLLQNAEEAEDISQDIFALLWQNRGNLKLIDNLDAYCSVLPGMRFSGISNVPCYFKIINPGKHRMIIRNIVKQRRNLMQKNWN